MLHNKRDCIVFLSMSNRGILGLDGVHMAVALQRAIEEARLPADTFAATLDCGGCESPAWIRLRSAFVDNRILVAGDLSGLADLMVGLLEKYERVLMEFAGGMRVLKSIVVPLKRRYGRRFRIVASVWNYRHGTKWQWLCSFAYFMYYRRYVDMVVFGCPYAARNFAFSSRLFRSGRACIMPLAGTSSDGGDKDRAWKLFAERKLDAVLRDESIFKLVYVAALRPVKNHLWLTTTLLPAMKVCKNLHMVYCGNEVGVKFSQIIEIAGREGLENRFHLPGWIPYEAMPEVLKHCDCAVVPSSSETYGFTYIEPMMFGLPVLGTRVGIGEFAIQDFFNGISFSLDSPDDFAEKVEFLAANRDIVYAMGRNARSMAQNQYSMAKIAEMRVVLYGMALAK